MVLHEIVFQERRLTHLLYIPHYAWKFGCKRC